MFDIHNWQSIYDYFYDVSRNTYGDSEEYAHLYATTQANLYYVAE